MSAKRGNIMLMVLFVMFVSSLLGLLVAQYTQNLIRLSGLFQDYYKSYYYSYAGIELGLAQVKHHGYGFQDGVAPDDFIYDEYTGCANDNITCSTDLSIQSRWHVVADTYDATLSGCLDSNLPGSDWYEVSSGGAVILPLFWDTSVGFDPIDYTVIGYAGFIGGGGMDPDLYGVGTSTDEYIVRVIDEDLTNYDTVDDPTIGDSNPYDFSTLLPAYTSSPTNKNYLIVANADGDTMNFCLQVDDGGDGLVSKYIVIDSVGIYGNTTSSLSAIKVDQLPSFLGYGTINSW